jgi:hypothetical protein
MAGPRNPSSRTSRYATTGAAVVLPSRNLAGKARAAKPGSDVDRGDVITNSLTKFQANAINNVASKTDVNEIIRLLIREEGLFSAAANSMVAISTGAGFRIAGYTADGSMDLGVMAMAWSIMDGWSMQHDYSAGYNDKPDFWSLLAMLQMDVVTTGGCGVELVLDQMFGPERLVPVGYSTIDWYSDGKGGRYPMQEDGEIDLNLPTVFMAELNRNPDEAYAVSPLRPGLTHTINFNSFLEDTHRSLNRTGHSRMIATITAEAVKQSATEQQRQNPEEMATLYSRVFAEVTEALASLEPEDALVVFDSVKIDVEDTGGNKQDYSSMLSTLGNLLGASLKTPASVSGLRASGGQGLSNAETLIYLKVVAAGRVAVESVVSRALTLAARLQGVDGYVSFSFNPIDLRPESELEAYRGTKQNRILTQLSHGVITDAVACYELDLRPQDYLVQLSGTGFYTTANTNTDADRSTSTGAALAPDTPAKSGGADQ